jgi:hypothetical protein
VYLAVSQLVWHDRTLFCLLVRMKCEVRVLVQFLNSLERMLHERVITRPNQSLNSLDVRLKLCVCDSGLVLVLA